MGNGGWIIMGEDIIVYLYILEIRYAYYSRGLVPIVTENPVMSYPSQYHEDPPLRLNKLDTSKTAKLCR